MLSDFVFCNLFLLFKDNFLLTLFLDLSLQTGGRFETILLVQKKDINLTSGTITLYNTKTKTTYTGFLQDDLIELLKEYLKGLDVIATRRIDILIREKRIDKKMATSLLNDSYHANLIISKLINVSKVLWIQDLTIKELGEDYEAKKNS